MWPAFCPRFASHTCVRCDPGDAHKMGRCNSHAANYKKVDGAPGFGRNETALDDNNAGERRRPVPSDSVDASRVLSAHYNVEFFSHYYDCNQEQLVAALGGVNSTLIQLTQSCPHPSFSSPSPPLTLQTLEILRMFMSRGVLSARSQKHCNTALN